MGNCFNGFGNMMGAGRGFMGMGIIGMIVCLAIIGIFIYAVISLFNKSKLSKNDEALEKLRMKFANDEITEEEFEAKKKILVKK